MRLFHRTASAAEILATGFRDGQGHYMTSAELSGVFLSDVPLDDNEGADGGQLLAVELPTDLDVDEYEVAEDGKPYREWCIPARLLNDHAQTRLLTAEEVLEAERKRWL